MGTCHYEFPFPLERWVEYVLTGSSYVVYGRKLEEAAGSLGDATGTV